MQNRSNRHKPSQKSAGSVNGRVSLVEMGAVGNGWKRWETVGNGTWLKQEHGEDNTAQRKVPGGFVWRKNFFRGKTPNSVPRLKMGNTFLSLPWKRYLHYGAKRRKKNFQTCSIEKKCAFLGEAKGKCNKNTFKMPQESKQSHRKLGNTWTQTAQKKNGHETLKGKIAFTRGNRTFFKNGSTNSVPSLKNLPGPEISVKIYPAAIFPGFW